MSKEATQSHYVLLVHGTWGGPDDQDEGTKWFQHSHQFREQLEEQPHSNSNGRYSFDTFTWSGKNLESARSSEAKALARHLHQKARDGIPIHLIAHSHGGTLVWEALRFLARGPEADKVAESLDSWTTVGTPFFRYSPDPRLFKWLWVLVPVVTFLILMAAGFHTAGQSSNSAFEPHISDDSEQWLGDIYNKSEALKAAAKHVQEANDNRFQQQHEHLTGEDSLKEAQLILGEEHSRYIRHFEGVDSPWVWFAFAGGCIPIAFAIGACCAFRCGFSTAPRILAVALFAAVVGWWLASNAASSKPIVSATEVIQSLRDNGELLSLAFKDLDAIERERRANGLSPLTRVYVDDTISYYLGMHPDFQTSSPMGSGGILDLAVAIPGLMILGGLVIISLYSLYASAAVLVALAVKFRNARIDRRTADLFGSRWLGLTAEDDEARNALKLIASSSLPSTNAEPDKVDPFEAYSLARAFSQHLKKVVVVPFTWIWRRYCGPHIRELLSVQLAKYLEGNDKPMMVVTDVLDNPADGLKYHMLPEHVTSEISSRADKAAEAAAAEIRSGLAALAAGGSPSRFFTGRELIHCSYFENEYVSEAINHHLAGQPVPRDRQGRRTKGRLQNLPTDLCTSFRNQLVVLGILGASAVIPFLPVLVGSMVAMLQGLL